MNKSVLKRMGRISSGLETCIGILILIGIAIMSIQLLGDMGNIILGIMEHNMTTQFEEFLNDALKLVIGIEFVKMLVKHTPESVIEVLVFAIARKLIVGHASNMELLMDIIAITLLFIIRKHLYSPSWSMEEINENEK